VHPPPLQRGCLLLLLPFCFACRQLRLQSSHLATRRSNCAARV
jgi:hypothetical protein